MKYLFSILTIVIFSSCSSDNSTVYDIDDARDNCNDQYNSGFYNYKQYQKCLDNI